jgi:hypothetical protein
VLARAALINVKRGCDTKLTGTLEQEVLPLFRSEKDFRGAIALVFPQGTRALLFSLWGQTGNAGAHCATSLSTRVAWQQWSWELGWFKSRISLEFPGPHHRTDGGPWESYRGNS